MKRLLSVVGVAVLVAPMLLSKPAFAQDGGFGGDSIDLSGLLGGGDRGGRGGNGNRGPTIPTSQDMFVEIQQTLKKGKTPLDKPQEKALQSLLSTELVALSDKIQLLRNNNNNNNNNNFPNNFPQDQPAAAANAGGGRGGGRGGRGGAGGDQAGQPAANNNNQQNQQPSAQTIQVDTITSLKNDDFIDNKLGGFLTPEQVALVKKAKADDKTNATCLGGLLDRYYNQLQNNGNRGNNNNNNNNNQNNNNNNANQKRPNGQAYCMTQTATPAERLEPIRKVLAKGNLPLAKDKDAFAEVFMKAQLQDLETSLRSGLTNNGGNRGNNNNNNRNNNPQQVIQTTLDGIYKKVEGTLNPMQADTLKRWHFEQMLSRNGIDALVAIEGIMDTPMTDEQIARATAMWTEVRKQLTDQAKAAGVQLSDKNRDSAAMNKILATMDPAQDASYRLAIKYGPTNAASAK